MAHVTVPAADDRRFPRHVASQFSPAMLAASSSSCGAASISIPSCRCRRRETADRLVAALARLGIRDVARVGEHRGRRARSRARSLGAGRRGARRHRRAADSGGDGLAVRVDGRRRDARLRARRARDVGRRRARRCSREARPTATCSSCFSRRRRWGRARSRSSRAARSTTCGDLRRPRRSAVRGRAGRRRRRAARRVGRHVRDRDRRAPARTRARPHESRDPIVALGAVISALQTIVSRRLNPATPGVVTIGTINAGIGVEHHSRSGDAHGNDARGRARVARDDARRGAATWPSRSRRGSAWRRVSLIDHGTPPIVNPAERPRGPRRRRRRCVGEQNVVPLGFLNLAGEDFAHYMERIPGCFLRIGAREPGGAVIPAHAPTFYPAEESIFVGAAVLAECARVASREFATSW